MSPTIDVADVRADVDAVPGRDRSSAGSTGGGIKMIRALILLRQTGASCKRLVHPRAIAPLTLSGQVIEQPRRAARCSATCCCTG